MQYIKAKFMKQDKPGGRAYTYRSEENLKPGDIVTDVKGSKLTVVDEPIDMAWAETYGVDKVGVVKKYVERKVDVDSLDDDMRCKYCTYESDCPKGVGCYGGEPFFPYCTEHEPQEWFDEEAYLADLEESEED